MDNLKDISNVHLLLVEDNARYLERLKRRLRKFGYQHLTSARSASEATKQLDKAHFDIIVADMRMEHIDSGFDMIDTVRSGNLSSIVIILTANDNVADCRKALKAKGAWDYISKTMIGGSALDELNQSIQAALAYFNSWGNAKDQQWISNNMGYLLDNFQGQYVAVLNNAVIAAANQPEALEQIIRERNLPRFLTIIEKIDDDLFKKLTENLIVFVAGPTDVNYIKTALKIFGEDELLNTIVLDTIGNYLGTEFSGDNNLKSGFDFLRYNRLLTNKVLFLFDPDVPDKDLANKGQDVENLYVRRMVDYSADKKGVEFLLNEDVLEAGIGEGFVEKTIVEKITAAGSISRHSYKITGKTRFCNWVRNERENKQTDFDEFQEIIEIIKALNTDPNNPNFQ